MFLKVHKIWKDKKEWMITIDNYINASWSNVLYVIFRMISTCCLTNSKVDNIF